MFDWFFNIRTKVKLVLLSGFLLLCMLAVSASGYMASTASLQAAEDISIILNRSYNRVSDASNAMLSLDNEVIKFLSRDASDGMKAYQEFENNARQGIDKFIFFMNAINEEKMGDHFVSPPAYKERVVKLKKTAASMKESLELVLKHLYDDRNGSFKEYLTVLRPSIYLAISDFAYLNRIQIDMSIALAQSGASMTPVYVSLGITLAAMIMGIMLSIVISRYVNVCVDRQDLCIEEMSRGNFAFEIKEHYKDDFGMIIDKIDTMRNNMNNALAQVLSNMDKTQETLDSVSNSSRGIVHSSEECQSKTLTVATAAEEMVATNLDIAKNCEDASNFSMATKEIIDNGVALVKHSIDSIRKQRTLIQENAVSVEKVAKRSRDINAIVNTIEEIASQTNLLALNAAIEAARAGEAGRGFAVVADEVRALASRTADSTKEIAKMVADIQHDAVEASNQISDSVAAIEETTKETESVEQIMHNIVDHVDTVTAQIAQIASAAEEQTAASHEISTNIQQITTISQEINNSAQGNDNEIMLTVNNLNALVESLSVFKIKR